LSTNSNNFGDIGYIGDKSDYVLEDNDREDDIYNGSNISKKCECQDPPDHRIKHNHPFYYCIEHREFQNIYLDSILHHLEYSTVHRQGK
jgi:hypothetical protein